MDPKLKKQILLVIDVMDKKNTVTIEEHEFKMFLKSFIQFRTLEIDVQEFIKVRQMLDSCIDTYLENSKPMVEDDQPFATGY